MLTADVSLAEVSRAALSLPDKERFALAIELYQSIPDEYEVDDDETLLRRADVQEGIQGMIDVIEGREQVLSEEEAEIELAKLEAEVLRERAQRRGLMDTSDQEYQAATPLLETYKVAS